MRFSSEDALATLDTLCRSAGIRAGKRIEQMAEALSGYEMPQDIWAAAYLVKEDPFAVTRAPKKVYEAFTLLRNLFMKQYGLDRGKRKKLLRKRMPHLLVDIVLGEHNAAFADRNLKELQDVFKSSHFSKQVYDLRHGLFVHESFVLTETSNEPELRVDLSKKHILNMEYCIENTPAWDRSFYKSSSALVSLAGSFFNILMAELQEGSANPGDIEGFTHYAEATVGAALNDGVLRREINRKVFDMCTRVSSELQEHGIEGHAGYSANLRKLCRNLRNDERQRLAGMKKAKYENR